MLSVIGMSQWWMNRAADCYRDRTVDNPALLCAADLWMAAMEVQSQWWTTSDSDASPCLLISFPKLFRAPYPRVATIYARLYHLPSPSSAATPQVWWIHTPEHQRVLVAATRGRHWTARQWQNSSFATFREYSSMDNAIAFSTKLSKVMQNSRWNTICVCVSVCWGLSWSNRRMNLHGTWLVERGNLIAAASSAFFKDSCASSALVNTTITSACSALFAIMSKNFSMLWRPSFLGLCATK